MKKSLLDISIPTLRSDAKIDLEKAIELRAKGLTYKDIGKHFGVSKESVHEVLHRYIPEELNPKVFREKRGDILAAKQEQVLLSLTEDDIKSIPPGSRATTFGILYDKERLERDLSTANVAYADITKSLAELEKEEEELLRAKNAAQTRNLGEDN